MQNLGAYAIPFIVAATGIVIFFSKKDLFSEFLKGGRDGFVTSVKILPSLVMLICAVKMFSASGALDILCNALSPVTGFLNIPKEILPVVIMRPISGSAANAMMLNLLSTAGPDSFAGRAAAILMGSSDTIFYTFAMYFSAAGIKKTRHALPASLLLMIFCILLSCLLTRFFFPD